MKERLICACPECDGVMHWCDLCEGTGEVLTQEGRELFDFMKRFFATRYELRQQEVHVKATGE